MSRRARLCPLSCAPFHPTPRGAALFLRHAVSRRWDSLCGPLWATHSSVQEGLARFATEPYDSDPRHYSNRFMHLTNYSVNKTSRRFVPGAMDDSGVGHKWSLTALRRR